jgi:hypothetical protein
MVTVPLLLEARIKLGYMLLQATGSLEDRKAWDDIETAIALTDEERTGVELKEDRSLDGDLLGARWKSTSPLLSQNLDVNLETDHAKRLIQLIESRQDIKKTDRKWAEATVKALKAAI